MVQRRKGFRLHRAGRWRRGRLLHYSAIQSGGYKSLDENQKVEFDVTAGPKVLQAENVRVSYFTPEESPDRACGRALAYDLERGASNQNLALPRSGGMTLSGATECSAQPCSASFACAASARATSARPSVTLRSAPGLAEAVSR